MAGKRMMKKMKERAKRKAEKAAAMKAPGFKPRYAQRFQARLRGEPMAARPVMPRWYASGMRALTGAVVVLMMLAAIPVWAKSGGLVGYRAQCVKADATYTSEIQVNQVEWAQRVLLDRRGNGWTCHLERSDDLGKTWIRVDDDGKPEGA